MEHVKSFSEFVGEEAVKGEDSKVYVDNLLETKTIIVDKSFDSKYINVYIDYLQVPHILLIQQYHAYLFHMQNLQRLQNHIV